MAFAPEEVQSYFEKLEKIAEEVLSDKQEIIDLDKRRNLNREALRQMKSNPLCVNSDQNWMCVGNMFMRLPRENIIQNIEKEQSKLDEEISKLRDGLRMKVDKLNILEGKQVSRGTGLKTLSKDELSALKGIIENK